MPKEFWAQIVECAVYLSNRSPTRSLWNKTPQQAWTRRKQSIAHLRVFGCMAYTHIPDQNHSKFDDKSEKHVFVGCDASSKGYKLNLQFISLVFFMPKVWHIYLGGAYIVGINFAHRKCNRVAHEFARFVFQSCSLLFFG